MLADLVEEGMLAGIHLRPVGALLDDERVSVELICGGGPVLAGRAGLRDDVVCVGLRCSRGVVSSRHQGGIIGR
jgi:hypothetical protein